MSRSFDRKIDAEQYLSEVETSKRTGTYVDPKAGRIALQAWADRWMEAARPALKPKTAASYESLLHSRVLPDLGRRQLNGLRPSDIQEWANGLQAAGLSPSRIRQAVVVLGLALDAAVRDGILARNVARGIRLPPLERREANFLDPTQVEAIAASARKPYDLLVRLLGQTGLRFGEAAALRRRSLDLLGRRVVVSESLAEVGGRHIFGPTKTHATRRVPLTPSLVAALTDHLDEQVPEDPDALVFTAPEGGPLRHSTFRSRIWVKALQSARIPPVGLHVLRHSAAAALIRAGASPKAVQTILGHSSAAFTLTVYGHIFEADLDELAARLEASLSVTKTGPGRGQDRPGAAVIRFPETESGI